MFLGVVLVLLSVVLLSASVAARTQSEATPTFEDICVQDPEDCQDLDDDRDGILDGDEEDYVYIREEAEGESAFGAGASAELLGIGVIPAVPVQPAALALQRVTIAPGAHIVTPADDPRVVLLYVERGTLTVRNTFATTVTRGTALATPGAQAQEAIPAETEFTMTAGDFSLSPAGSGGEWRNDGTEEVVVLAGVILPIPTNAATPAAGTPVP
jgi:quercetin dioxygenase-like cupin family protein